MDSLARQYRFNESVLKAATDGFAGEHWGRTPPGEGGNTAHWIVGHLAAVRHEILRRLGDDEQPEWEAHFATGGDGALGEGAPPPAELIADFEASGERLERALAELDESRRAEDHGGRFPDGGSTLADGLRFYFFHETYHLGQLGMLRRLYGLPGFA